MRSCSILPAAAPSASARREGGVFPSRGSRDTAQRTPQSPLRAPCPQAAILGTSAAREGPWHEGSANALSQALPLLLLLMCEGCFPVLGYLHGPAPHPIWAHMVPGGGGAGSPGTVFAVTSAFGAVRALAHSSAEPPGEAERAPGLPEGTRRSGEGLEATFWGAGGCRQPPVLSGPSPGVTSFPHRAPRNHRRSSAPAFPSLPGREAQAEGGPRRLSAFGGCPAPRPPWSPRTGAAGPLLVMPDRAAAQGPAASPGRGESQRGDAGSGLGPGDGVGAKGMLEAPRGACTGPQGVATLRAVLVPGVFRRWVGALGMWEPPGDARRWGSMYRLRVLGTGTWLASTHRGHWGAAGVMRGGIWGVLGWGLPLLLLWRRCPGTWWPQPGSPVPARLAEREDGCPGGGFD